MYKLFECNKLNKLIEIGYYRKQLNFCILNIRKEKSQKRKEARNLSLNIFLLSCSKNALDSQEIGKKKIQELYKNIQNSIERHF